jgi:GNAT acetyltransferase-like protein
LPKFEDCQEFPAITKMSTLPPTDELQPISRFCCYRFDPIQDLRWAALVEKHPKASVFHTVAWLQALRRTYGYKPVAFTTSPPTGELKNGIVFCLIDSWLTGCRLVSLPFSDHCEPLCDSTDDLNFLIRFLQTAVEHQEWKYLEIRPISFNLGQTDGGTGFLPCVTYFLHTIDLRPDLDEVFQSLHKDSVQRRIQRAERAGLAEKCGRSDDLLEEFYTLFVITRGRHHLPPIPYAWFRNLIRCHSDALEIRLAYKDKTPVAAILTLRFNDAVYFKYGCSDARFHKFGATPWLLWRAIAMAKRNGALKFDMGRTEEDNVGLLTFKNRWVPKPQPLVYWKFPGNSALDSVNNWKLKMAKRLFSCMPNSLLRFTGKMIYRHIG